MSRKPQCPVACQDGLSADPDLAHLPSKPGNCDRLDRSWRSRSAIRQASCSRPRLHRASCPVRHYSAGWHSLQACRAIIDVAPVAAIIYRSSNRTDWRDPRGGCMPVPPPPTTLGRADNWIMAGRQLSPWRGLSVSITCLSSTSPSCVERCRRTSLILIIGVRIDRFASVRPAIWQCLMFDLERPAARSSRSLYLADCLTFTGAPHDRPYFCVLHLIRRITAENRL
jgi:hypothetical protein